jgi:hypothetical protein
MNRAFPDGAAIEGPDYLALVIEWDEDEVTAIVTAEPPPAAPSPARRIATVAGALAALALATWGLHRLRAA